MAKNRETEFPADLILKNLKDSLLPPQFPDLQKRPESDLLPDDLIVTLSEKKENRRARQVFEWECVRRKTVHRSAQ